MRLHPDNRKEQILDAAVRVAAKPGGWSTMTRRTVAIEANCADALVSKYFGTMPAFKRTIMRAAVKAINLSVIAQGIATGDKYALKADDAIKAQALATLSA